MIVKVSSIFKINLYRLKIIPKTFLLLFILTFNLFAYQDSLRIEHKFLKGLTFSVGYIDNAKVYKSFGNFSDNFKLQFEAESEEYNHLIRGERFCRIAKLIYPLSCVIGGIYIADATTGGLTFVGNGQRKYYFIGWAISLGATLTIDMIGTNEIKKAISIRNGLINTD